MREEHRVDHVRAMRNRRRLKRIAAHREEVKARAFAAAIGAAIEREQAAYDDYLRRLIGDDLP